MKTYLNAGFGHPLGIESFLLIQQLGFDGIRADVPEGGEEQIIREFADPRHSLRPIFLVNGGKMREGAQAAGSRATYVALLMYESGIQGEIEIGNEPNIAQDRYRHHPEYFGISFNIARGILDKDSRLTEQRLIVGGIMTTDKKGLDYLEKVVRGLPPKCHIGYHTYRSTTAPNVPMKGFSQREDEFARLRGIAGGRELWNTEIGWHTAESKTGLFGCNKIQYSNETVYDYLRQEADYNRNAGAKAFTVFQLNDGPTDHYENRFGIRTHPELALKPSSQIAKWINA